MDFSYPSVNKRTSVRVTAPQLVFELQNHIVDGLDDPDTLMNNFRITRVVANVFGDDCAITLYLSPTTQAKTILLSNVVRNVDNCRRL